MKRRILNVLFIALLSFACQSASSAPIDTENFTLPIKFKGFLGPYRTAKGTVYEAEGMPAGTPAQEAFQFGEVVILSRAGDGGYTFQEAIEAHCHTFDLNRIWGMVVPPSESGVVNNPNDTADWTPASPPGMIQGAARYSRLSKNCPQIAGMIIDDFIANYPRRITLNDVIAIKDALKGKTVADDGTVSYATPDLKLAIVLYEREIGTIDAELLKQIDAINFWTYNQDGQHRNFEANIRSIQTKYPGKEIIPGIYILNGDYPIFSKESVHHLLTASLDLYENHVASGMVLFAGHWVTQEELSKYPDRHWPDTWKNQELAKKLNEVYYPYLGQIKGRVVQKDASGLETGVGRAIVKISWKTADQQRLVSRKFTKEDGSYEVGVWAGRQLDQPWNYLIEVEMGQKVVATQELKAQAQTIVDAPVMTIPTK